MSFIYFKYVVDCIPMYYQGVFKKTTDKIYCKCYISSAIIWLKYNKLPTASLYRSSSACDDLVKFWSIKCIEVL